MTTYLSTLILLLSMSLFYSSKADKSRVVTIHKPLVITQERRTPAFYVYQQAQSLLQGVKNKPQNNTKYLSQDSVVSIAQNFQLAEMSFTKREYAQMYDKLIVQNQPEQLTLEKVIFNQNENQSTIFEDLKQELALSPEKKWATLRGKFELRDGVGITDHISNIRRVEEGQTRELGQIDLKAGTYSIDIESPNGYLIAQIKDQAGLVIGEDRKPIINLQNKGPYFEGPFIRVGRPETLAANFPAVEEAPSPKPNAGGRSTANASTSKNNIFQVPENTPGTNVSAFNKQKSLETSQEKINNVSHFSSTIMRLDDPAKIYASMTTIRHVGDNSATPQLTQKWLEGVLAYVSDLQKTQINSKTTSTVIGRVQQDGLAVAGAQVLLADNPEAQVIYLDEFMIPSPKLVSTSTNGYFIFINLKEDIYEVAAYKNSKVLAAQLFVAENSRIAFQNIISTEVVQIKTVRSFDAFSSEPLAINLILSTDTEALQITNGSGVVKTYQNLGLVSYYVQSVLPQYLNMTYVTTSSRDYVHIPLVPIKWLEQIRLHQGLYLQPNTGTIIGFTQDINYSAYLAADNYNSNNIVYFDSAGLQTLAPTLGGGFILFNVPVGAREVVLQQNQTEKLFSQVFNIKTGQISLAHFTE